MVWRSSATAAARSSIPGGRPRPARCAHLALPGRDRVEARLRRPGPCPASSRCSSMRKARNCTADQRQPLHFCLMARPDAHRLGRPPALLRDLFLDLSRALLHRRRLPPRRGRLLLDHRPRRRRDQRVRPPRRHRRSRKRLVAHPLVAEAAVVPSPTRSRVRRSTPIVTLNAGEEGGEGFARNSTRGPPRDRRAGRSRANSVRARPSEDPVGQDHAPDPAQDRGRRDVGLRGHVDAGRPERRRVAR